MFVKKLFFALMFIILIPFNLFAQSYEDMWKKVDAAERKGLPQSALKELDPIYKKAIKEKNHVETINSICKKVILEGVIQGNQPHERIIRFEEALETADNKIKPMLKIILAKWYYHYYTRNRIKFLKRTKTSEEVDLKDFRTWDLPRIFSRINNIYDSLLEKEEELSSIPLTDFKGFLTESNQPPELIANLYEFLIHDALDFYTNDDQTTIKPKNAFELDSNAKVFSSIDEFINFIPESLDTDSSNYRVLKLYQKLISFNKKNNNIDALLNNNIERIQWAYKNSIDIDKDQKYVSALKSLISEYSENKYISSAYFLLANYYCHQEDYLTSINYAENAYNLWPDSFGGISSYNLIQKIKKPSIALETENNLMPGRSKIKIYYRNLNHVYFRLIKRSDEEILKNFYGNKDNLRDNLFKQKADFSFDAELDNQADYKKHFSYVTIPNVEKGYYWILASSNPEFSEKDNALFYCPIQISNLSIISINNPAINDYKIFVLDAFSGKPIEGAEIKIYEDINSSFKERKCNNTGKDGYFKYNYQGFHPFIICKYKDDKAYISARWYPGGYSNVDNGRKSKVYFFTDRSIYRPGQTVYFKAIATISDKGEDEYDILKNWKLDIRFRDRNRQEINKLSLTTNEFGSCSGQFIIPSDRLTGDYSIYSEGDPGQIFIKVEEYKRPTFKVEIDPPSEGYQLNQVVKLKGRALSYTGAVIDNAEVKFRVVRKVDFPKWIWWIKPIQESQELNNGIVKTDENGEFEIDFIAKPDYKINRNSDPRFTFNITADVTDNTGETRSGYKDIKIGYTAMNLTIASKNHFDSDKSFDFSICSTTHDGKNIPANGKVKIISLIQPDSPERHSYTMPYFGFESSNKDIIDNNSAMRFMKEGKVVFEEDFSTNNEGSYKKSLKLSEGIYRIKVESKDRFGKEVTAQNDIIALSYSSEICNVKLPFFVEVINDNLKPGDTFKAFWGTGYDKGPAYVEIYHRNNVLKSFWTNPSKNKEIISLPITENMRGGFYVKVFQVKDNSLYKSSKYINVDWTNKNLNLKLIHFTSKMEPGSKESWKVEISGEKADFNMVEMLATMYDASLDAFIKHNWNKIDIFYKDNENESSEFSNNYNIFKSYKNNFTANKIELKPINYQNIPNYIISDYYGYCYEPFKDRRPYSTFSSRLDNLINTSYGLDVTSYSLTKEIQPHVKMNAKSPSGSVSGSSSKSATLSINEDVDLSNVHSRSNLKETAFFQPHLSLNEDGIVTIDFEMPEALTTWKFLGFAHGKELQNGVVSQEVVTQKEIMIQPNTPRFLREGDKIEFSVKVTNLSDKDQSGSAVLDLIDAVSEENRNSEFNNNESKKSFSVPAKQSRAISWVLDIPHKPGFVKYKVVGATNSYSDGEEGILPILSSKVLLTESLSLPIRWAETKKFKLEKLINSPKSKSLKNKALTVEMSSNPAWYAVQGLPYLMEYPFECSEQTFNRLYANKLAQHIANSNPKIKKVFETWEKDELYNKGNTLLSNLEKNQHLKSVALSETPWVLDAKNENEQKHKMGILFNDSRLNKEIQSAYDKLKYMQLNDGSFPWFHDGRGDAFLTMYIMTGFGRLRNLGVDIDLTIPLKSADFLDKKIADVYEKLVVKVKDGKEEGVDLDYLDPVIAFYLYGRSFFVKDRPLPMNTKEAVDFFIERAKTKWLSVPYRISQAHLAIALYRFGQKKSAKEIVDSIKERSLANDELGRFWSENEISYSWKRAEIETQAMMIEIFNEVTKDEEAVEDCKVWLLKQKQTQSWKSTKATADAIYALLLRGTDLLASNEIVKVSLANKEVKPDKIEAGTGYYEKIYSANEITPQMGNIQVSKEENGVSWGAVHWQYFEDMTKVTPFEKNLKLKKGLFIKNYTDKGLEIKPIKDSLRVGDLVVVRIELETDRDLEYVHMKDQRGSGMEPVNVLSKYKRQDGLFYYETTKDSATHFFISYLPKGKYVFEYELRAQLAGSYQTGIAEIMCMYAPEFNSHSESFMLNVEPQQ